MKKLFILGLLSTALLSLQAESEMLKGYKKNDFAVVCSENFNSGSNGWIIPKGFSVDNKDGILGTAALHGVSYNKKGIIPSPFYKIKIKPGATYKITLQYRVKNFQLKDKQRMSIVLGTIFYKDQTGKKKAKYFWDTKFNASESWTKYYTTIKIPNDAKENAELKLHFDWWHTGEIWYDEVLVESADLNAVLIPVKPNNSAMDADGKIAYQGYFYNGTLPDYKNLKLYLNVEGKEYLVPANKNYLFETKIDFPIKDYFTVTAKMLNTATKQILTEYTCRLSTAKKNGNTGTRLDENGVTWLNGKKFLPIGFFTYQMMREDDYKRLSENGFNFVSFGIKYRNPKGIGSNSPEKMNAMLALLEKYNLKGIVQLVLMVPGKERLRVKLEGSFGQATTPDGIIKLLGESIRNNKNLLAYYLSDENPRIELPDIRKNREILAKADPNHMTLSLTNNPDDFTVFAPTGDVFVYDTYPFGSRADHDPGTNTLTNADAAFKTLLDMKTPWWLCTQAYDRAIYRGKLGEKMPEERQLTALPLLAAIYNAKGFYYFSYHAIFEKGNKVDPNHSKEMWPRVASSGKLLNKLAPYILGDKTAPAMKIIKKTATLRGRRFIADNGKEAVILVSIEPKAVEAFFELPDGKKYKSLRNKAVKTGKGTWKFASDNIDYDVLIEE